MTQLEEEKLTILEKRIGLLEENTSDINKKVDRILGAVIGDQFGVGKGIVGKIIFLEEQKIPDIEKRLLKVETFQSKFIWMAAGAGIASGIGMAKLFELIQHATP